MLVLFVGINVLLFVYNQNKQNGSRWSGLNRWSSDAGISRLGHPKMADAFPGKQLRGRISPCIGNRHSPYLDHMTCIWIEMDSGNRIWQKRSILCKREGNKSRRDAGFSPSWFCHDACSSIPGCRYLLWDAPISSLDFMLTVTQPTYFIYLYIHGLCWRIENLYHGASSVTISRSCDHPRWGRARTVAVNNLRLCQRYAVDRSLSGVEGR